MAHLPKCVLRANDGPGHVQTNFAFWVWPLAMMPLFPQRLFHPLPEAEPGAPGPAWLTAPPSGRKRVESTMFVVKRHPCQAATSSMPPPIFPAAHSGLGCASYVGFPRSRSGLEKLVQLSRSPADIYVATPSKGPTALRATILPRPVTPAFAEPQTPRPSLHGVFGRKCKAEFWTCS